jgi:hypothetical protein
MSDVDVTVVVPCYNTEAYLDQALSSAEQNDRCSLEFLVINDGSTDGSLSIMREHERRDSRVRVIDKVNQGYGASVNRGFSEARGTYVAILEPDDWVEPHMYDSLFQLGLRYGLPDMVKSSYWRICHASGPDERRYHCAYYRRFDLSSQPLTLERCPGLIQRHPSIWSALYRRSFLCEEGIRLIEAPGAGWVDGPFCVDTCARAQSIAYTDEPFYDYREDVAGASSAHRDVALSFVRWNEMLDILQDLHSTKRVLQALYVVGFHYVGYAIDVGQIEDPALREASVALLRRMEPSIVRDMPEVSTGLKHVYFELTGYPEPSLTSLGHIANLADELWYSLRCNGPAFAVSQLSLCARRNASEREA